MEDDSILDFLTSDFLESQTTSTHPTDFLDFTSHDHHHHAHPPSPPTSIATYSESSGSPNHSHLDSGDDGPDLLPTDTNPLEYWQYVYDNNQNQPGAWPLAMLPPSSPSLASALPLNSTPPSPVSSLKAEKRVKRAKNNSSTPATTASLVPLAPLAPMPPSSTSPAPLKPLLALAPQPAPPTPPVSVHDTFIKQSPPLSPCIIPATSAIRRPSIIPALTPSLARSNPVIVKSTLIPDEKPQSEAVMTAQAKRQERLIKNRAAALLSRKRKREHINLLESHTDLLKMDNQDLKERVSELEENVKVLTEERDAARQECERLHRQITVMAHRPHLASASADHSRMDLDLERNLRGQGDSERNLNSKATGVVFMIILFSFALFTLPSGKLDRLMVGGSMDRPRIGSSIVGRALDAYAKNPTISGQVRSSTPTRQDLDNMTDLAVFSDNRALQTWLGHQPVSIPRKADPQSAAATSSDTSDPSDLDQETIKEALAAVQETTKSVGFVAQSRDSMAWNAHPDAVRDMHEPERDALLYCSNLLYSLGGSSVVQEAGPAQSTNGEIRRPRLSFISPLDGVVGSSATEKTQSPPWMPKADPTEDDLEQRYLRLDVEVTSSRVVSGKGLGNHEQLIRFPLMPVGVFDNITTSLTPAQGSSPTPAAAASSSASAGSDRRNRPSLSKTQGRGVTRQRKIYDTKDQRFKMAALEAVRSMNQETNVRLEVIKEEPMEVYIKEEPMD